METKRAVNEGAEKLLGAELQVLDKGFIRLVDYLGTDETVVSAARVSYNKSGAFDVDSKNEGLIDMLMSSGHSTPFEQCALVFEVKAPIVVFREWHRHRTAKLNEQSGRYTQLAPEFYTPEADRLSVDMDEWLEGYADNMAFTFAHYDASVKVRGIKKEVARLEVPVSTYSRMVWQSDLSNLLHFLSLREAPGAMWEIRQYANMMANVVRLCFPKTWAAYEEHVKYAKKFSRTDMSNLKTLVDKLSKGLLPTEEAVVSIFEKVMSYGV